MMMITQCRSITTVTSIQCLKMLTLLLSFYCMIPISIYIRCLSLVHEVESNTYGYCKTAVLSILSLPSSFLTFNF